MKMLYKTLFFGSLTIAGFACSAVVFCSKADAQSPPPLNNTEIVNYSRTLLQIEPERQQAFDRIKQIIGDREIPKIVCNEPTSFNSLPSQARDIAVNYCKRSVEIAANNNLSSDQFNKITVELQNNKDLERQIYNTLIRLQKNPDNK